MDVRLHSEAKNEKILLLHLAFGKIDFWILNGLSEQIFMARTDFLILETPKYELFLIKLINFDLSDSK